ncbi:DUF1501 domain-containing protein [Colwelliaceae bacterium 6441]
MKRRHFMKAIIGAAGANSFLSGNPMNWQINPALAAEGKTLVVIFQRGGCDGLNSVIPYTEERYYELRPTIAIAPPDENDNNSALDLNGHLGLHPALSGLHSLYQQNRLAVFPTTHYPNGSRSHFQSQFYIESGQRVSESDGWINRHMQSQRNNASYRAVGFGNELAQSLRGDETVSSLTRLANFDIGIDSNEEALLLQKVSPLYQQSTNSSNKALLNRFGQKLFSELSFINDVRATEYQAENGAVYSNSNFSGQLRDTAQLIKSGVGLEIATVDIGGWDTHSNQGGAMGNQARRHQDFAEGIAAFVQDMGQAMDDIVLITSTEFGRTAAENGSQGTDHGYASTWYAIGGGIQGGVYGDWPGLQESDLRDGRFLNATMDYRNIYAEVLKNHLFNTDYASILPDFTPTELNLFT